jgi:hypothetical protein
MTLNKYFEGCLGVPDTWAGKRKHNENPPCLAFRCPERGWECPESLHLPMPWLLLQGCGIVEFENPQEAADAINKLHNSEACHTFTLTNAAASPQIQ